MKLRRPLQRMKTNKLVHAPFIYGKIRPRQSPRALFYVKILLLCIGVLFEGTILCMYLSMMDKTEIGSFTIILVKSGI